MVFVLSILSSVSCQGVLSLTILCLRRCSVYIGLVRRKMGAYLGYQHWLRFLVMFGLCVKGIEEGSLEKISCICWMTLILFLCRHKWVRIQDKTILLKPAILNEIKSVQYLPV